VGGGHTTAAAFAVASVLLLAGVAAAAPCGDDVNGARVACRCGDTVVSDTRLLAQDPVVAGRCPLDGLAIRASALAESITLDLAGLSLVGTGAGVGIDVEYGGADGARIIGAPPGARAIVRSFDVGVATVSGDSLAVISRLEVLDNRRAGLRLVVSGTVLDDVVASGNGDDGVRIRGTGGRLIGVVSNANGGHGVRLTTNGTVVDAWAEANGGSGIVASGARNDLSKASAAGNAEHGIVIRGGAALPDDGRSVGNAADALRLNGARLVP
jgi:hypothetical protein